MDPARGNAGCCNFSWRRCLPSHFPADRRKPGRTATGLSPGDVVTFDFLDDAELPVALTVTADGNIQFPLIGDVAVSGLTVSDALTALRRVYQTRDILKDPKVALNITT
ncbi:MAG: polysaccharide biosynthesis/export family protein, partial [Rhizobium sp.]|nr:polysaccharide biosynthesis/export family protein [Rhizobium sp.]